MKKNFIIISAVFIVATAFTLAKPLNNLPQTRNKIVENYLLNQLNPEYYSPETYPDTTLKFKTLDFDKEYPTYNVVKSFKYNGFPSIYGIADAITPDNYYHNDEFNKVFIQQFKKSLFGKHVKMVKDENGYVPEFFFYSAEGIQAAFNQLYVKPNNKFEQATYQTIYNLSLKEYMRDFTKYLAYIMGKKQTWVAVGNHYLANAKTVKDFNVWTELEYAHKKLFPTETSIKMFPNFSTEISYYDLGTLLRRQCDGTLPTLLNCLKIVLKDYDPEALKLIKGTF